MLSPYLTISPSFSPGMRPSFSLEAARFYERAAAAAARVRCPFSARCDPMPMPPPPRLRYAQADRRMQAGRQAAGSQRRAGGFSRHGRASVVPERYAGSGTFRLVFHSLEYSVARTFRVSPASACSARLDSTRRPASKKRNEPSLSRSLFFPSFSMRVLDASHRHGRGPGRSQEDPGDRSAR